MRKLIFNSILKDYKDSLPTIVIISFMICVVFSSLTAQYSQSSYVKKIIENNGCIIFSVDERNNSLPTLNFLQKNRNTHQISCII